MKRILFALLLVMGAKAHSAESVTGPVGGVFIDSIRVHTYNQTAYVYTASSFWATNVYRIDMSSSNVFGRDMLAVALSAMNTGKQIKISVNVEASPPGGDCSGTTASPNCPFGAFIRSILLVK